MADIRNKNELKHRIDVFLHEFTSDEYKINEEYCKETMRMMADFIGLVNQRIDQKDKQINNLKKELKQYRDAEEQGLLLRLLCEVGDKVYEVTSRGSISEYQVRAIRIEPFAIWLEWKIVNGFVEKSIYGVEIGEIGKTVFLTKEEAEQALKQMESEG